MKGLIFLIPLALAATPPPGPLGPSGAIEKYDLLRSFPGGRIGAFNTVEWDRGHVNNEVQYYRGENAHQDPSSGQITITAERRSDGKVYSARYRTALSSISMSPCQSLNSTTPF